MEKLGSAHNYAYLPLKAYHGDLDKKDDRLLQSLKNIDQRIENLGNDLLLFFTAQDR